MTQNSEKTMNVYIKDNIFFTDTMQEIHIPIEFESIKNLNSEEDLFEKNKKIIKELEKIQENKKTLNIGGEAENPSKIVEKLNNSSQKNFQKPSQDSYKFLEITSTPDILDQFIKSLKENKFWEERKKLESHINDMKTQEEKRIEKLKSQLNEKLSFIEGKENNKKQLEEEISQKQKKLNNLENKKKKLQNHINRPHINSSLNSLIYDFSEKRYNYLSSKKEKLNSKISLLEEKKTSLEEDKKFLEDQIKLGKNICAPLWKMIFSIGLYYWSEKSSCRYKISLINSNIRKIDLKINKIKIHINNLNKKLEKINSRNDKIIEKEKNFSTKTKKFLNLKEKSLKKVETSLNLYQDSLEDLTNKKENIDEKLDKLYSEKEELENLLKYYQENSLEKLESCLQSIEKSFTSSINYLEKKKKKILSQKTDIKGEWIVKIPIN